MVVTTQDKYILVRRTFRGSLVTIHQEGTKAVLEIVNAEDIVDICRLLSASGIAWDLSSGVSKLTWEGTPAYLRGERGVASVKSGRYPGHTITFSFSDLERAMQAGIFDVGAAPSVSGKMLSSGNPSLAGTYFHGTYDYSRQLHSIIKSGLDTGSSISNIHGQATAYPIILEFVDLHVEPVYYRPGDFKLLEGSGRPKAVYVYPEEFGKPVRTVDEINKDLGVLLGELEAQGLPPEEVGEMMFDYPALYRVDKRLGDLIKELNESADLEARGVMGRMGGEDVLDEIKKQAAGTGIPVYRVERDEEGEIRFESRRQVL